jgi:lipopolysaccharide transport system permease protein
LIAAEFRDLWRVARERRALLLALTRDDLRRPFSGSGAGLLWAVVHPLVLIVLYLFVFGVVFQLRLGPQFTAADYGVYLTAGLLSWTAWASVITQSCQAVVGNAGLVRQAHFPADVLPVKAVLLALTSQLIGLVVVLLYAVVRTGRVSWMYLLLPVAVILQALAMLGLAYLLSAASVFVRDVKELAVLFVTVGVFAVPAFYTPPMLDRLSPVVRSFIVFNPLSMYIDLYRDCLVWQAPTRPISWAVALVVAFVAPPLGRRVFGRLRTFFGNFL